MASKPFFEPRRGEWHIKYKPDPAGPWVRVKLCKHPLGWSKDRPPKRPPQLAIDRAKEFAEIEYRAKAGLGVAPARPKGLAGYVADYLETYRLSRAKGSYERIERHARDFTAFAAARGETALQSISRATCRDFLEARFKAGISHNTLRTERGFLAGIWSRALEDRLIVENPWKAVKPPGKMAAGEWTFWSDDEVGRIAAACGKPWQADLVTVMATTGLRISAALALAWSWLDWKTGTLTVPAKASKSGKTYSVPMTATARTILERRNGTQAPPSPLVFPNPRPGSDSGVVSYETARCAIDRAIKVAGVTPGTPHDLRHTFGRWLALQGVPVTVIQSAMGHASLAMTQRYLKIGEKEGRRFLEGLAMGGEGSPSSR